jgi:hypothetical protein
LIGEKIQLIRRITNFVPNPLIWRSIFANAVAASVLK